MIEGAMLIDADPWGFGIRAVDRTPLVFQRERGGTDRVLLWLQCFGKLV